jgi:hypothetical protein
MDQPSSSSPQREHPVSQDEEMDQIVSQMEWDDEGHVGVESRDDEGPQVGQGAWVGGQWHDLIDPHPLPHRESRSKLEFDPEYVANPSQVMTTRLLTIEHLVYIFIDYA